jgi:hypothetical protein
MIRYTTAVINRTVIEAATMIIIPAVLKLWQLPALSLHSEQ